MVTFDYCRFGNRVKPREIGKHTYSLTDGIDIAETSR
jgi:hypothetical protein